MKRIVLALVALGALALAGCQTSQTSATGWGQIAAGVGQVVGSTKADPKIEKVMAEVHAYCPELRIAATGASLFSPQSVQKAAEIAATIVRTACDSPAPKTAAEAIALSGVVFEAVLAVRQARNTSGA